MRTDGQYSVRVGLTNANVLKRDPQGVYLLSANRALRIHLAFDALPVAYLLIIPRR